MSQKFQLKSHLLLLFSLALLNCLPLVAQQLRENPLPNGEEFSSQGITLRVEALRADVIRVRMWRDGQMPEDASWAVLSGPRSSHVPVAYHSKGFATSALHIEVDERLRLTVTDREGNLLQKDIEPVLWDGSRFRIYKRKALNEHFFGLGDKPGPLDRAGEAFVMWNSDMFGWQESTDPIYKSIPFFISFQSGRALGVLFDNTRRSFFDFGRELPDAYSFGAPDGPIDYYLIYGPAPKRVIEGYAWLTGPTPLPPLWSLGYQQSRYSYEPESRLMQVAKRLRDDHIPADALYLDIDFQQQNRPFTVDEVKFPNFGAMVQELAREQFHLVVITDLHIADLPGTGYAPYDTGFAGDHFVKNADGSAYVGSVWPGPSVFPDFTREATRDWWGSLYRKFAAEGVAGFWNDMNEPAVFTYPTKTMPDDVQHRIDEPGFAKRTTNHLEIHNVYGMENSRATYEGLLKLRPDERPFVLTRASYAGGQRYAATWTGDNSSTWNHLRQTVPQLLNLGLSGFSMSGADVGGFAGSPSPDLLTRWIQLAAFQPLDRDHAVKGSRDHEPWVDGPEHESIRRRYIEERYRLLPYIYTAAEETSRDGMPLMRPLFLEFPDATTDGRPLDLEEGGGDEYMFGGSLLIAPSPSPEEVGSYKVQLPPGIWYDYWTGAKLDRRGKIPAHDEEIRDSSLAVKPLVVSPALDKLPIYVRGGSIIPLAPLTQSTEESLHGDLVLRVYPGEDCNGSLYQDDGRSFAYREGHFLRMSFHCEEDTDGSIKVHIGRHEGDFPAWWRAIRLEVFGSVLQEPKATAHTKVISDDGRGIDVRIP